MYIYIYKHGVQDFDEFSWMWKYVITVGACRRIFSCAINHWRRRKHEKDKDALGFFSIDARMGPIAEMRGWIRSEHHHERIPSWHGLALRYQIVHL